MSSKAEITGQTADVKISCDRNQIFIRISGNVSAKDASNVIKKRFRDMDNQFFLQPDITALPDGYMMSVYGRQSVKDYLSESPFVSCYEIFSVCKTVIEITDKYGADILSDIMFDYAVTFVENNDIKALNYIYVPFLHSDESHMNFTEFIRILFIHMSEKDAESEESVIRLIDLICKWELSGYSHDNYLKFALIVKNYFENYYKKTGKDLLSKGTGVIKQFVENLTFERKGIKDGDVYISFIYGKPKKQIMFIYDTTRNMFFCMKDDKSSEKTALPSVKIGRDSDWADWHIPDMTVNGRLGILYCNENKFFIDSSMRQTEECKEFILHAKTKEIKDGQTVLLGRMRFLVKIGK